MMDVRDYIRTLMAHWQVIGLLCLSAVVSVILLTFLLNDKYKTSTLVLITPQREVGVTSLTSEKQLLNFPVSPIGVSTQTETPTKTYIELIHSRPVLDRVVTRLGLAEASEDEEDSLFDGIKDGVKGAIAQAAQLAKFGRLIEGDPFDEAVGKVGASLWVAPTRNSYVFAIECVWPDPAVAAAIANETAEAFVVLLSEISGGEASKVRKFVELRREEAALELEQSRNRLRVFEEAHGSIAFQDETVERIKLIARLDASLAAVDGRLSGELAQFGSDSVPRTPKVLGLQAERDELAANIAARTAALAVLPGQEAQLAELELDVKTAEKLFELIAQEYEEARIREAKQMSDIRIVASALVPSEPIKPIKILYVAVALALALMLGVGGVLLLEVTDRTLRRVEDVEAALGVRVLATVPPLRPSGAGKPSL